MAGQNQAKLLEILINILKVVPWNMADFTCKLEHLHFSEKIFSSQRACVTNSTVLILTQPYISQAILDYAMEWKFLPHLLTKIAQYN